MKEGSNCCKVDVYRGDDHVLDGLYCSKCHNPCSMVDENIEYIRKENIFNAIQADMLRGTIQERLGYDLYDKILNHTYEGLPPASKEKFEVFLKKEQNVVVISDQKPIEEINCPYCDGNGWIVEPDEVNEPAQFPCQPCDLTGRMTTAQFKEFWAETDRRIEAAKKDGDDDLPF